MKQLRLIIAVLALMATTVAMATEPSKVTVKYQGKKYYVHKVVENDTLYSLSKAYGVSQDAIKEVNELQGDDIKQGESIYIPFADEPRSEGKRKNKQPKHVNVEGEHIVRPGETLYSLSRTFKLSEEELLKLNGLSDHTDIKAGMTLRVAAAKLEDGDDGGRLFSRHDDEQKEAEAEVNVEVVEAIEATEEVAQVFEEVSSSHFAVVPANAVLRVTLLLPFHVRGEAKDNIVDFYRGVLLGLEDLKAKGRSIELTVLDTERSVERINDMIAFGELDTQLIIGPVYGDEFAPLLSYAESRNIPVVSPLQNVEYDSPVLFNMPPSKTIEGSPVVNMLDGSREVVMIYASKNDVAFINDVRSTATHTRELALNFAFDRGSFFYKRNADGSSGEEVILEDLMREKSSKVFLVMASSATDVDRILTTLSSTRSSLRGRGFTYGDYVVIGSRDWMKMTNIDSDIFFHNDVHFIVPYYANRIDEAVRLFDGRYVASFSSLPSRTSYRGYDAAIIFCNMMYDGLDSVLGVKLTPLTTPYKFEYSDGAYENTNWVLQHYRHDSKIVVE
ncbi:MAG: LysM peptidoglycan-binding domain-containing protein [Alistipes sp.]|nr:LysM peptidoglycan-binding domain-containing protein [Alistipes sp.]